MSQVTENLSENLSESQVRSNLKAEIDSDEATVAARAHRKRVMRRWQIIGGRALVAIVVLGGWQLFTDWGIIDSFFVGQPTGIVHKLIDWYQHGTEFGSIWAQIGVTMEEALMGFVYGVVSGVVCGLLLGQVPFLAAVFGPYIKIVNAIPRIVLGAIFVVWLGLGTTSKEVLAAVLVFFVVFFNAFQGVREVDRIFISNARVLGASRLQITRHVILPSALTWITASLHVAFGFAVIGAIVGEFLGAQHGLGLVISNAMTHFDPNGVFGAMLIIGAITLTAEGILGLLEKRLLAWRPPSQSDVGGA